MSEREIQEQVDRAVADKQITPSSVQSRRRKLLKSTVAIPVIMTLHSGAALARSSNMAGAEINLENAAGDENDVFCAAVEGEVVEGSNDLGDNPSYIRISRQAEGGTNRSEEDILQECAAQNGIIISSGAFNSIAGKTGWTEL